MTKKLEVRSNLDFSSSDLGRFDRGGYLTKYRLARKLHVFSKYSEGDIACVCCQCPFIEYLTLDHISGGSGREHRKATKNNLMGWAIKNQFPPIFQILCHVCNASKGANGRCVYHQHIPVRDWGDMRFKEWVKENMETVQNAVA